MDALLIKNILTAQGTCKSKNNDNMLQQQK